MSNQPDPRYVQMGKRIKALRWRKEINQALAARHIGVSSSFYGHIERGTRKASVETICKVAVFYEASLDHLLGDFMNEGLAGDGDLLTDVVASLARARERIERYMRKERQRQGESDD